MPLYEVTSRVILDIQTDESTREVEEKLIASHNFAVGNKLVTVTGTPYTLVKVEWLKVERLP